MFFQWGRLRLVLVRCLFRPFITCISKARPILPNLPEVPTARHWFEGGLLAADTSQTRLGDEVADMASPLLRVCVLRLPPTPTVQYI